MKHSDPVRAGLAEGLRPRDVEPAQSETVTVDVALLRAAERLRVVRAVEHQAELSDSILAAQLRTANAAERQADALETLTALFASCIGRGHSSCAPDSIPGSWAVSDVFYLRAGDGTKSFGCDRPSEPDDD